LGLLGSKETHELNKEINKMYAPHVTESSISIGTNSQAQTGIAEPPIFLLGQLDALERLAAELTQTLTLTQEHNSLFFETPCNEKETPNAKVALANYPPSERLKILVETMTLCSDIAERNRQAISRIF
tara:strand:+ start:136 stop:519 length:384 start_codon:yes stop_codon:yes gene_type:complete